MTEKNESRQRKLKKLWIALAALAVLLAVLIVPPLVSVSRYKAQITYLISHSLGRPVRLSSVEVRLLPRPGFVLNDLTVDEDPAYGAEPVLHANTVTAPIRLLSLWRGRLEIDSISVDEASVNLVRTSGGYWNIDPILRTAKVAAGGGESGKQVKLPYLAATNSRINIKNGAEKLPFSLVNTDLSFWQQNSGEWRVRLKGQPARTDLSIEQADTGVVRLEASLHQAPQLRQMPVHLDLEWRSAQLGQLTRLMLGSDAGWRGNLTGELHLDGTAEAAQVKTRLRATGVHREEFAPAVPLDFDANCGMVAHFSSWGVEKLVCDSPLGGGHIRLTGDLPAPAPEQSVKPNLTVELDRIPVSVGLDALRTVRSDLAPGLQAAGSASGKFTYAPVPEEKLVAEKPNHAAKNHTVKAHGTTPGALTGSVTVDGVQLSGGGLSTPILLPKFTFQPVPAEPNQSQALTASVAIAVGAVVPLTVNSRLAPSGYQLTLRGQASVVRGRELAHLAGVVGAASLDALAGESLSIDLTAQGPWMPAQKTPFSTLLPVTGAVAALPQALLSTDSLTGSVTLHNANWKVDYLVNPVLIAQATLHLNNDGLRWDQVAFAYGPVKGTATLSLPANCGTQPCVPHFEAEFGALDASVFQAAFLGAHEPGTLVSTLLERLRPTVAPAWPPIEGTVKAESLILGPVTLHQATATVRIAGNGAQITGLDAGLLGGRLRLSGALQGARTVKEQPSYALEAHFEKLSPIAVGQLLGLHCTGSSLDGNGKLSLSGFTSGELADSAKGALHFEWRRGGIATPVPALAHFDSWMADAAIANGGLTLGQNLLRRGGKSAPIQAAVTFGKPSKAVFPAAKEGKGKR
jgi:hypothetical protein